MRNIHVSCILGKKTHYTNCTLVCVPKPSYLSESQILCCVSYMCWCVIHKSSQGSLEDTHTRKQVAINWAYILDPFYLQKNFLLSIFLSVIVLIIKKKKIVLNWNKCYEFFIYIGIVHFWHTVLKFFKWHNSIGQKNSLVFY